MASFVLDQNAVQQLLSSKDGPVGRDIMVRTNRVLNAARRLCPVDQGTLRSSLASELRRNGDDLIGRVGTNLKYALFVHEGTGIYAGKGFITPKTRRVLRWPATNNTGQGRRRYKGGKTSQYVYSKRSKGMPGRPFLRNALDAGR